MDKNFLRIAAAACLAASAASVDASDWIGGSGTWSSDSNPGWNGTGVPGVGSSANFFAAGTTTRTVSLDVPGTVGSVTLSGSANQTTSLSLTYNTVSNGLTLDNNGSASVISNSNTSTGGNNRLSIGGGTITLQNDLTISNTGSTTNASSIALTSTANVVGSGNITFYNVSNLATTGAINWTATSTFTGNLLVQKGAVAYGINANFGNSANVITLGSSGNGSATLMLTASTQTIANKIVVAAGSGGTLLLGNNVANATNVIFSGTVTLNDNVSLYSRRTGANSVRYTGVISGNGGITTVGDGITQLGNGTNAVVNTYTGNTTLSETSAFTLANNARMTFAIGADGVNNKITAIGTNNNTLTLDGTFAFDLTGAAANGTWQIVDVSLLNETFNQTTFGVFTSTGTAWTENSNVWTYTSGSVTYSFSEATGALTAVPEPTTALLLGGGLMVLLFRRRRR